MKGPIFSHLFGSETEFGDEPVDLSDAQQQKKILSAIIGDLQKREKQQRASVVYDPVLGISQIFKLGAKQQKPEVKEEQKEPAWKKLTKFLTCSCIQGRYNQSFQMITVLFDSLKAEQYSWLQRHYNRYTRQQLDQLKQQYVLKMARVLELVKSDIQKDLVDNQIKKSALACVNELQLIYKSIQPKKYKLFSFAIRKQNHYVFMLMISAFQVFNKNYTTYQRAKLKNLFQYLQTQTKSVHNSIEVLRFLQNKDPLVAKLQLLSQSQLDQLSTNYINDFFSKSQQMPANTKVGLVRVSDSTKRRRVVNFLISGFLSQDKDKKQQWNQLLACMPDSEVYGLQWESNTIIRLVKFLILSIKDMVRGRELGVLLTKDNPFIPAFEVSIQAGQMLAYIAHKLFPFQFINIIGYSLGSELIRAFVHKTIELNGGKNLNKVIVMGGVSDVIEFENTLQKTQHTINILNVQSKHDSILKYILKRAKPHIKPVGLNDLSDRLKNHLVKNVDASKQINGHFAYMTNFGTIAELLMLNQE